MESQEMRKGAYRAGIVLGLVGLLLASGCGSGDDDLAGVTGTVTLDGEPVKGAIVQYIPQALDGTTSYGLTDEQGQYLMSFTSSADGVLQGMSKVTIESDDHVVVGGKAFSSVEVFPTKYNIETELTADVTSGSNVFDFNCESDERSRRAMTRKKRPSRDDF